MIRKITDMSLIIYLLLEIIFGVFASLQSDLIGLYPKIVFNFPVIRKAQRGNVFLRLLVLNAAIEQRLTIK